jgi:hypothetical protein
VEFACNEVAMDLWNKIITDLRRSDGCMGRPGCILSAALLKVIFIVVNNCAESRIERY